MSSSLRRPTAGEISSAYEMALRRTWLDPTPPPPPSATSATAVVPCTLVLPPDGIPPPPVVAPGGLATLAPLGGLLVQHPITLPRLCFSLFQASSRAPKIHCCRRLKNEGAEWCTRGEERPGGRSFAGDAFAPKGLVYKSLSGYR